MGQAKWVFALAALLTTAACGDLPVAPTRVEADGAARLFSAPSVTISGPGYTISGSPYTWYANASGGDGSYTYQWEVQDAGASYWLPGGSGSSFSRTSGYYDRSFTLRVTVTSARASASAVHYVYLDTCNPWCA